MESVDDEEKEHLEHVIEVQKAWIDSQRWKFLVEVNVGAWSGKTTREMAEARFADVLVRVGLPARWGSAHEVQV